MKQTKILLSSTLVGHNHMKTSSSSSSLSLNNKQISTKEEVIDISNDDNITTTYTINDLNLPNTLISRLYDHQKEGVSWLLSLYYSSIYSGGILGDDMGLGKTFQVSCFLTGLLRENKIKAILIVCPVSVLRNWYREFENHLLPHVNNVSIDMILSETTKKGRSRVLDNTFNSRSRQIVITSYHLVSNMVDAFTDAGCWDYVILDEGHTIKNPQTKISKSMQALNSNKRLILTGTPIQNNLMEMWCLVDWVTKGNVIGNKHRFTSTYADPILKGQDPRATPEQRHISSIAAQQLLQALQPILLQRKKCEKSDILKLTEKNEIVIWVPLSKKQRDIYDDYLSKRDVINALERANYPVEIINHLKTLCRHPYLLEASEAKNLAKNPTHDIDELAEALGNLGMEATGADDNSNIKVSGNVKGMNVFEITGRHVKVSELLQDSVKLRVLLKLTKHLIREDHRILIFSQAKMMLDIIQRVFADAGMSTSRIDGSVAGKERQRIIDEFNAASSSTPSICLLTTRACGYGITLTGADRVIIFDPSWNPSEDRQAVDRAYRIGQTKDVVVYRMIMASSVEEKMYEKQVFKDGLRIVTECGETKTRYFSSQETKALFTLGPPDRSVVMEKLWAIAKEKMPEYADCGDATNEVLGYSRHDNLYEEVRPEEIQKRNILPPSNAIRQVHATNHSNVWVNNPKYVDLTGKPSRDVKTAPPTYDKFRVKVPINIDSDSDSDNNSKEFEDNNDDDYAEQNNSDIFETIESQPSQGPFTLALSPNESFEQITKRLSIESLSDRKIIQQRSQKHIIISDSESDNDDEGYKSCNEDNAENNNEKSPSINNDAENNNDSQVTEEMIAIVSKLNLTDIDDDWVGEDEAQHSFITTIKKKLSARRFIVDSSSDDDDDDDDDEDIVEERVKRLIFEEEEDEEDANNKELKECETANKINATSDANDDALNNDDADALEDGVAVSSVHDDDHCDFIHKTNNVLGVEDNGNHDDNYDEDIKVQGSTNIVYSDLANIDNDDDNEADIYNEVTEEFDAAENDTADDDNYDDIKVQGSTNIVYSDLTNIDNDDDNEADIYNEVTEEFDAAENGTVDEIQDYHDDFLLNKNVEDNNDNEANNKENNSSNDNIIIDNLTFDHFKKVKIPLLGNSQQSNINVDKESASYIATLYAQEKYKNLSFNSINKKDNLSETAIDDYNSYITLAQAAERRKDRSAALAYYTAAMSICDDNILLHGKIAYSYQA